MSVHTDEQPITDKEPQPTLEEAIGNEEGLQQFIQPDVPSIIDKLLSPQKPIIAISSNIPNSHTVKVIVSMETYADITEDLFRNVLDPDIQKMVHKDSQLIRNQISVKLRSHKALKGYTTNKIVEAIAARIARQDRQLRATLAPKSKTGEAL